MLEAGQADMRLEGISHARLSIVSDALDDLDELYDLRCQSVLHHREPDTTCLFELLGLDRDEIAHSRIIGDWLLSPSQGHGLGDRFLIELLRDAHEYCLGGIVLTRVQRVGELACRRFERRFPRSIANAIALVLSDALLGRNRISHVVVSVEILLRTAESTRVSP